MDTPRIEKRIGVRAPTDRIWEVITSLEGWDRWNPVETGVEGKIVFGGTLTLNEAVEGQPPRQVQARIGQWQPYAQLVWAEKRGLWFNTMRYFEIDELAPGSCIVANGYLFSGLRGEMYFDKHRKALRHAVEGVAEGWKTVAEA